MAEEKVDKRAILLKKAIKGGESEAEDRGQKQA